MMNDLEFQRQAVADPHSVDPEFLQAAEQNAARIRQLEKHKQGHDQLRALMQDVSVPEGLSERILLKHSMGARQNRRSWLKRLGLALAATLGLLLLTFRSTQPAVAGIVFEHLDHDHSRATLYRVAQLPALMSEFGSTFEFDDSLKVLNVMPCIQNGKQGLHFEVLGPGGLFVVLVLPEDGVAQQSAHEHNGMTAKLYPWGQGTMAVVGRNSGKIDQISERLMTLMPPAGVA